MNEWGKKDLSKERRVTLGSLYLPTLTNFVFSFCFTYRFCVIFCMSHFCDLVFNTSDEN